MNSVMEKVYTEVLSKRIAAGLALIKPFFLLYFFIFSVYFIGYAITVFQIFSLLYPPSPLHPPTFSSCPCVVHVSSLASLFPILFLTSPHLFYACQLCFLFTVPFPATFFPSPSPLKTLHVIPISLFCSCSICLLSFCFAF